MHYNLWRMYAFSMFYNIIQGYQNAIKEQEAETRTKWSSNEQETLSAWEVTSKQFDQPNDTQTPNVDKTVYRNGNSWLNVA